MGVSAKTIRRLLKQIEVEKPTIISERAVLAIDTTYFGDDFGVMVFRDVHRKKNLFWKYVKYESLAEYIDGIKHLESMGCSILGIVCDGKKGLFTGFGDIPVQMCQYHQIAIIKRYTTQKPKLEAGKELLRIAKRLTKSDQKSFTELLNTWYLKWSCFLRQKTVNAETGAWFYTHKRLRSAYRSLKTNLPYLFVFEKFPELNIPNTTNSLEGTFSAIKMKVRIHRGLKKENIHKLIDELLAK